MYGTGEAACRYVGVVKEKVGCNGNGKEETGCYKYKGCGDVGSAGGLRGCDVEGC